MAEDCLKLTAYFGERDRVEGRFFADALIDLFERRALRASVLLRGTEGFGARQRLQTQRLLSLSEDLPLVAVGLDVPARVEQLLEELRGRFPDGLLTVERARLVGAPAGPAELPAEAAARLTVFCGRSARLDGQPAARAIVERLRGAGAAGAAVFLGVDGTAHGQRRRARFFSRNAQVPLMVVGVGEGERIAAVAAELARRLPRPLLTVDPVTILRREGVRVGEPAARAAAGPALQKLTVYASEQARLDGHPLYAELVRRLRRAEAPGATALRAVLGFEGAGPLERDRLLSLRRHVPVATVAVGSAEEIGRLWPIVEEATARHGLVTCEPVAPASP